MFTKIKKFTKIAILSLIAVSCSSQDDADKKITPETIAKLSPFLQENMKKDGVITTASGLQYTVITEGEGAQPAIRDGVTVHYQGTLVDGTEFDSSYKRGTPASFPLNRVIKGWTEGLQLMSVGSKYKFFIPSYLAYGDNQKGNHITPNSDLIFTVELISIKGVVITEFLKKKMAEKDVITLPSKVSYKILKEGTGISPEATDTVEVHYEGRLIDGTIFDSSYKRGETISFSLNRVIPGWTIGLQEMKEGAKYEFYIPSYLAYGERGAGADIGPNQDLIFIVELITVEK